jgi:hypothetical protein
MLLRRPFAACVALLLLASGASAKESAAEEARAEEKAAQGASGDAARDHWLRAGEAYLRAARDLCGDALARPPCDALVLKAAQANRSGGSPVRSVGFIRKTLGDAGGGTTPSSIDLIRELAFGYMGIAEWARAADAFEAHARKIAVPADAAQSWKDALLLRLALREDASARAILGILDRSFPGAPSMHVADAALAVAASFAEREEWLPAELAWGVGARHFEASSLDIRVSALALEGKLKLARVPADRAAAETAYRKIETLIGDPSKLEEAIKKLRSDEGESATMRRLGKALVALGQARLFFADAFARSRAFAPLGRSAPATEAELLRFRTSLDGELQRRTNVLREVEGEYLKVTQIAPVPPPDSVVRAGGRVAALWISVAEELFALANQWKASRNPLLQQAQEGLRDRAVVHQAKAAALSCVALSTKLTYRSPEVDHCEAWLVKRFPDSFHARPDVTLPLLQVRTPAPAALLPAPPPNGIGAP